MFFFFNVKSAAIFISEYFDTGYYKNITAWQVLQKIKKYLSQIVLSWTVTASIKIL